MNIEIEHCDNCMFFREVEVEAMQRQPGSVVGVNGRPQMQKRRFNLRMCCRYPNFVQHDPGHWCGEYGPDKEWEDDHVKDGEIKL